MATLFCKARTRFIGSAGTLAMFGPGGANVQPKFGQSEWASVAAPQHARITIPQRDVCEKATSFSHRIQLA